MSAKEAIKEPRLKVDTLTRFAPESAESLLARIKPYTEWVNERPRSEMERAMYVFVLSHLEAQVIV